MITAWAEPAAEAAHESICSLLFLYTKVSQLDFDIPQQSPTHSQLFEQHIVARAQPVCIEILDCFHDFDSRKHIVVQALMKSQWQVYLVRLTTCLSSNLGQSVWSAARNSWSVNLRGRVPGDVSNIVTRQRASAVRCLRSPRGNRLRVFVPSVDSKYSRVLHGFRVLDSLGSGVNVEAS